jgi:glycosyltransferase involved in cell wall biosynthesis
MKQANKKVLFIVSEDWYFLSHRLHLAKTAIENGYQVALLSRISSHREFLESIGLTVFDWSLERRSFNPIKEMRALWQVIKAIYFYSPNLIHAVALKPIIYTSIACKWVGMRRHIFALGGLGFIFNSESWYAKILRPLIIILLRKAFSGECSRVIVQNSDDLQKLLSLKIVDKKKIRLIKGAGVDTQIFSPLIESSAIPLVVLPARLLWSKGVGDFVTAASNLKAKGVKARFALVGERDPHNPECIPQSQIDAWEKEGMVEIWGRCEDMSAVMNKASIVCLPSYSEGLPKALLEAASCARPIVAYDIPGCRGVVVNEDNGFLVPSRNQPFLDNAIESLINDSDLRKKMGDSGRLKIISEYSQELIAEETLKVWGEVLL